MLSTLAHSSHVGSGRRAVILSAQADAEGGVKITNNKTVAQRLVYECRKGRTVTTQPPRATLRAVQKQPGTQQRRAALDAARGGTEY